MHTQTDNRPRRLVRFDLPPETVEEVDRLADAETISRAAWIGRLRRRLFIRQDEIEQWGEAIRDEEAA
jgi:hypothetical protein